MDLKHVVITSVDRDDIKYDYGASIWAETIDQIHINVPGCNVEVLTPILEETSLLFQKF